MKKRLFLLLLLPVVMTACSRQPAPTDGGEALEGSTTVPIDTEETTMHENTVTLSINGQAVNVRWEENETAAELLSLAETKKIEVQTQRYGGFEQVGSLPRAFSRNDSQITTEPGDIVLYSGDQIVVFFGSNSWSYTKLGHIEGLSEDELKDLLGGDQAFLEICGEAAGG